VKLTDYPPLSHKFKQVYKKYFANNADPFEGLKFVDDFLTKYPYYPEALVFKARMLIALSKNKEALQCLKAAQKIDEWRVIYAFDQAEILMQRDRQDEAIDCVWSAITSLLKEAMRGTSDYLLSINCSSDDRKKAEELLKQDMIKLISGNRKTSNLREIKKILGKKGE
jgi:tetratricopeptide (TPR) repeat protein